MTGNSHILRFERFLVEQSVYPAHSYMPPHTDKLSRISIILEGQLEESAGAEKIAAGPGSLVIKPNHVVHENVFGNKPVRSISISFYDDPLLTNNFNKWQWFDHPKINVLGIRLWTEMQQARSERAVMSCFNDFFAALTVVKTDAEGRSVFWQERLKTLLKNNLSEPENIQLLSKKLSLHRVYVARAFKNKYGVSPIEFRKYTRVAAAILELSLTGKSLVAIAFDAGFADQSHMNREFKQCVGCTPNSFRIMMTSN